LGRGIKPARMRESKNVDKRSQLFSENGMEWNGMEWNGMEWNGMEWNGMEWNGRRVKQPCRDR